MPTGHITLHGITNAQLILILQEKERDPRIVFYPQALHPVPPSQNPSGEPAKNGQIYNNAVLGWTDSAALKTIVELLRKLELSPNAERL